MANWRGAWGSGTAYTAGDSITYGGTDYYCVTANTGQTPGVSADWALQDSFEGPAAGGGGGITPPAGDLGGSTVAPTVTATHLSSPLPVAQGGTNAATAGAALTSLGAASASALTTETSRAGVAEALLAPLASPTFTGTITQNATQQSYGDLLKQGGELALAVPNSAGAALASAGTITTAGKTAVTLTPTGAVTGVIMAAPNNYGATLAVLNTSAYSVTMAASGTSNVANGVSCVIPPQSAMKFVWNEFTALWYPTGAPSPLLAPLASPALTGTPTAPTQTALTASTALATAAYADSAVGVETTRAAAAEALRLSLVPAGVKTSAYTAAPSDLIPVDTTAGNVTITLPVTPANLTLVGVKQVIQGGTNTVTVACGAGAVFNAAGGTTTRTLTLASQAILLLYASGPGIWYVLADDLPLSGLDARYTTPGALTTAVALALPLAGGTMSGAIAMGASKITGVGNGTAAQDAAAFGQIPAIDSTATDIQPLGTRAAGATGKLADAGHVHALPTPSVLGAPGPQSGGYVAWTGDYAASGALTTPTSSSYPSGGVTLCRMDCPPSVAVNGNLSFVFLAVAGLANTYFGLYNSAGTLIGVTADQSAQTSGLKRIAVSGFTATPSDGLLYVAYLNGTGGVAGGPKYFGAMTAVSPTFNLPAPYRCGRLAGSLTSLASMTLSTVNSSSFAFGWYAID